MDAEGFKALEPFLDRIAELAGRQLDAPEVHRLLAEAAARLGERYTVSLNVSVKVYDQEQERALPLLNTGLSACEGQQPYRTWGDSSPQRYVLDGEIQVVPH